MPIRWRKDGRLICSAMSEPEEGDTYIDGRLSYELTVNLKVIVADRDHKTNGLWYWTRDVLINTRRGLRVLICGSRNWKEEDVLPEYRIETYIKTLPPNAVIIHGAAPGADTTADRIARERGHPVIPFKANWGLYGDPAGPIRNQEMLDVGKPDRVAAFHEDIVNSKGTKDMIARARKAGLPVEVING